jgi:hypothetical protein
MFYNMKNRIRSLIKELNVTQIEFAESIGTTPTYLSQCLTTSKRSFGVDFLLRIKHKYPNVNLNWLIADEGEMFLSAPTGAPSRTPVVNRSCPYCKDKDELIAMLKRSLSLALESVDNLKRTQMPSEGN